MTALSQLIVATGKLGCSVPHPAVIDSSLNPPVIGVRDKARARWSKSSASFSGFFFWHALVCLVVSIREDSYLRNFWLIFFILIVTLHKSSCTFDFRVYSNSHQHGGLELIKK